MAIADGEKRPREELLWDYWEGATAPLAACLGVLIVALVPLTLLMRGFVSRVSGQQG